MNRNLETRFAENPNVDIERSILDLSHGLKTSCNVGEVIPIFWMDILPGDTINLTTSVVARLQTLLTPIMDDVYVDTYWYFTRMPLLWEHTKEFFGENTSGPWVQQNTYTIPKIASPTNGWTTGTIADYLGVPPNVEFNATNGLMPSALPFRCYAQIMNEWFRDQNLSDPLNIPTGDSTQTGTNGSSYINDVANGGMPFKACKYHDYFTSCLPDPQKAMNPVTFPLISGNQAPVYSGATHTLPTSVDALKNKNTVTGSTQALSQKTGSDTSVYMGSPSSGTLSTTGNVKFIPSNLWADLTGSVGAVTINQLRLAFQMQKFYEKQARSGSRYREVIKGMFNVTVPDARMMIPEYLGGHRFPLNIHQVANTSQDSSNYLGDVGAMSNTSDIHEDFIKSFSEWGILMGLMVVRYDHTYAQGLSRAFTRENYFDFYWPVFANIGEQPVYKYEIDATIRSGENRLDVFGYQEAWAAGYRYQPNRVSGEMRPQITNSLASWHLADNYSAMPSLSDGWIREDKAPVDRVLAVTSSVANQVFADFYFDIKATRPMPMFSIPGLIDHH